KDNGIFISQAKYVADILTKFDFVTIKTASTPIKTNKALLKDKEAEDVDVHLYRSMIGSLMYLTASRPDIMFVVCACARFQVTLKVSHLHAVKRIFRYLKGQPKLVLWYPRDSPFDLEAFSDSDYAGASLDRKSTTGGCQFLGKRQVLWIQNQMLDYGFNFMNTKIHIDNESTICIVKNPVFHSKTKNNEIKHHFIRDSYKKKLIQVIKIHTDHNVADLLTKAFDVSSDEFRVKTSSCKVNAARQDLVILGENENAEFHQIVDFLTTSSIHYALTVSPTIYASYIEQFWATAKSKTVNDVKQIHATVDGKTVIALAEPFNDIYVTPVHTKKVFTNMKRQNKDFSGRITPLFASMLVPQVVEGEGSGQPSEPQPPSSTAPPSQVTTVATQHQKTHKPRRAKRGWDTEIPQSSGPPKKVGDEAVYTREDDRVVRDATTTSSLEAEKENAHTRFKTASKKSHDPPLSEGNTSRSGEDSMEHLVDLTAFVPPTPHDSPLSGGHIPGSDEGRPNFNELINLCTQLSNRVHALENAKTAQGLVIQKLKKRVKRLEKALRARTPGMKLFKICTSRRKGLDKENVSKQERKSNKTKLMFNDCDFDVLDDAMENVEGVSIVGTLNVSAAGPSTRTAGDIFEDEMTTIMSAQTQGRHEHDFEFIAPEEDYTIEPDISTANVPVSTAGAEVSTASPEVKTAAESLKTKLQLEQERLGMEEALRLQEQLDEEERQRIAMKKLALSML
ncbi:hypothetical protein Tco_0047307, partial [Tanacetum coccineum]